MYIYRHIYHDSDGMRIVSIVVSTIVQHGTRLSTLQHLAPVEPPYGNSMNGFQMNMYNMNDQK